MDRSTRHTTAHPMADRRFGRHHPPARLRRRLAPSSRSLRDRGQATLAFVFGLTVMMATGAGILATNVMQHFPLVQNDVVAHYAYRALEAGMNTFVADVNANANQIACRANSPTGGQCTAGNYNSWKQVQGTSGPGVVPEWYLWENPVFCFTNACTSSHSATANLLYVKVTIYGAAGFPGHLRYQSSAINLQPQNGFLNRVWWSNYEATDPALTGSSPSSCTQDWKNGYRGPNTSGSYACGPVYFGPGDRVYGPIFSNDSIYEATRPTLGPTQTADPKCLFITGRPTTGTSSCHTSFSSGGVSQATATAAATSKYGVPVEPLPVTDSSLAAFATLDGCLYKGPTTIEFDSNDQMTVWSPDTATTAKCPSNGTTANVPNGGHGNGVIYVDSQSTASQCKPGANPFDNYTATTKANGPNAQWGYKGTYYDYFGWQPQPNCEGDAFVSNNPRGGGISGQLTVATANNVVVTGNITYTHCGSAFTSTVTHPCAFNPTGTNDVLGLIATNYVEVNRPVRPNCQTFYTWWTGRRYTTCSGVGPGSSLEPPCTVTQLGTPAAALCNPGPVTIDAAILALNHSFTVNNEGLIGPYGTTFGVGPASGALTVYGSIDQDWRGAVGIFGGTGIISGYAKNYDWDSRIAAITPPHYLNPGTPSWALVSSATDLAPTIPTCCPTP